MVFDTDREKLEMLRDTFSPRSPYHLKFYMPMAVTMAEMNRSESELHSGLISLTDEKAICYTDTIRKAILEERAQLDPERGMMIRYGKDDSLNAKVLSYQFDAEAREGKLWGIAECELKEPLNGGEMNQLTNHIIVQVTADFGFLFEQRKLETAGGNSIHAAFRSFDRSWTLQTEQERFAPAVLPESCYSILPSTGEIMCIKRGENCYYPCDWEEGEESRNRMFVNAFNRLRGVTPEQEQAMAGGCLFGWDTPAADPSRYQQQESASPSMSL